MLLMECFRRRLRGFLILVSHVVSISTCPLYLCVHWCFAHYPTAVGLFIGSNAIDGHLPTEIGLLTSLGKLFELETSLRWLLWCGAHLLNVVYADFSMNNFAGTIPSEVGLMASLSKSDTFAHSWNAESHLCSHALNLEWIANVFPHIALLWQQIHCRLLATPWRGPLLVLNLLNGASSLVTLIMNNAAYLSSIHWMHRWRLSSISYYR
jgi:hypothetical protein